MPDTPSRKTTALNASQLRTICKRIEAVDYAMRHLRQWVASGKFNAYGIAHVQKVIFPWMIETGQDPHEARRDLYKTVGTWTPGKRFTSPGTMGELPKLVADGYHMVDSAEEAAQILANNGDVE